MTWKQEFILLKHAQIREQSPNFYEASGGKDMLLKPISDKTANGLTKCICEFLTMKGHYANRINTQGQARVSKVQKFNIHSGKLEHFKDNITWTPGSTRRGTPDIDAIINGKPVKIEVKVGKDQMSEHQVKEKGKIEQSGGYYFIARDMESFYSWYNLTFND